MKIESNSLMRRNVHYIFGSDIMERARNAFAPLAVLFFCAGAVGAQTIKTGYTKGALGEVLEEYQYYEADGVKIYQGRRKLLVDEGPGNMRMLYVEIYQKGRLVESYLQASADGLPDVRSPLEKSKILSDTVRGPQLGDHGATSETGQNGRGVGKVFSSNLELLERHEFVIDKKGKKILDGTRELFVPPFLGNRKRIQVFSKGYLITTSSSSTSHR